MEKYGLTVDLVLVPGNAVDASRVMTEKILPLHEAAWNERKKAIYGHEYDPNITALMQMWYAGTIKIILVNSGESVIGYMLCLEYRPITHNIRVMQVEDWYVKPGEYRERGEKALFAYMQQMAEVSGCHEIWAAEQGTDDVRPFIDTSTWAEREPSATIRNIVRKRSLT